MAEPGDGRGVLYPERLPTFHRVPVPDELSDLARWFWIPRWDLAPGRVSRQELLPFPASNLVVEPGGVALAGPATRISQRELRGTGWAVGALLRPAGVGALAIDPVAARDAELPFAAPSLHAAVSSAMRHADEAVGRERAVAAYADWLRVRARARPASEAGLLANAMEAVISEDRGIRRVEQLSERLGVSTRRVQRLAQRFIGLPPLAVIRRYRLQEAAERLRRNQELTVAQVAADLGYADQAHLASDFRQVLGLTANAYRRSSGEEHPDARMPGTPPRAS